MVLISLTGNSNIHIGKTVIASKIKERTVLILQIFLSCAIMCIHIIAKRFFSVNKQTHPTGSSERHAMTFGIQQITLIILFIWFAIFIAGKWQQSRIKKQLLKRIRDGAQSKLAEDPALTLDAFYDWVFEGWDTLVRENAWFILNQRELWPVPADPERVKAQMNLTPEWLGAYLQLRGYQLEMNEAQAQAVSDIVQSIPPHRRQAFKEE
jgi:hypothetical protein